MHITLNASQPVTIPTGDMPGGHSLTPSLRQRAAAARRFASAAAVALGLLLAALAQPALAAPNRNYNKNGISFQYSAGWKIANDEIDNDGSGVRTIDLEGPDDEDISFFFNPTMSSMDLAEFASTMTKGREESAKSAANADPSEQVTMGPTTSTPITRRVNGKEIKGLLQSFTVTVNGKAAPGEARLFSLDSGDAQSVMIMTLARKASAKRMEATLGLVLDTLRYRAKR